MLFNNSNATLAKFLAVTVALTFVGCEPAKPTNSNNGSTANTAAHNDDDHAQEETRTLPEAVKALEDVYAVVKTALEKDDAETAHEPMHEIPYLLGLIPKLAEKSTLESAAKEEIEKAAKILEKAFGDVDGHMHGADGKKYSDVAEEIDAAMKTIVEKSKG